MQNYINALQDYCKQNPLNHGEAKSVMEFLYWHYAENNPIDDQNIRNSFAKLRQQYPHLSLEKFDPIFTTVSDLCAKHERLAFLEGLRLGVTLMMEFRQKVAE